VPPAGIVKHEWHKPTTRSSSLEPASASSRERSQHRRCRRLGCFPKEAFKSFETSDTQQALQSCVSSTTKQEPAGDVCASQQVLEEVKPTHEATEGPLQETPAGFVIGTMLDKDNAPSGRKIFCPAVSDGRDAGEADTGRASAETPRVMARLVAPSMPSGSRRPQPAVRNQARHKPSNILLPTTLNQLLDTSEVAEEHRREREAASPSPVTGPSRPGRLSNILQPTTLNLLMDNTVVAEEHHREREAASPSLVTGPSRPGSRSKVHRGSVAASRQTSQWTDLYQDWQRSHACHRGRSLAGIR